MKYQKGNLECLFIFILSPFLSVPVLLYNIYKNNRIANYLLIGLLSIISYLYIPSFTNDKLKYLVRYEDFKRMSLTEYFSYLVVTKRPDFLFESLNFIFSKLNIGIENLFFLVTFTTLCLMFKITESLLNSGLNRFSNKLLVFVLFIVTISLQNIFSGIRFYFALSIVLTSIYFLLIEHKSKKFIVIFLIGIFTHFSMLLLLPCILVVKYFKNINFKIIFGISFLFFFIPVSILQNFFEQLNLTDAYANKTDVYLTSDDQISQAIERGNSFLAFQGQLIWYYLLSLLLLFSKTSSKNVWLRLFFVTGIVVNITYSVPVVFYRYSLVLKVFLFFYIITNFKFQKRNLIVFYFFVLCSIGTLIELNQMRYNLRSSLFKEENLILYGISKQKMSKNTYIDI